MVLELLATAFPPLDVLHADLVCHAWKRANANGGWRGVAHAFGLQPQHRGAAQSWRDTLRVVVAPAYRVLQPRVLLAVERNHLEVNDDLACTHAHRSAVAAQGGTADGGQESVLRHDPAGARRTLFFVRALTLPQELDKAKARVQHGVESLWGPHPGAMDPVWARFPSVPTSIVGLLCSFAYLRFAPLGSSKYRFRLDHNLDGQKEFLYIGAPSSPCGDFEVPLGGSQSVLILIRIRAVVDVCSHFRLSALPAGALQPHQRRPAW